MKRACYRATYCLTVEVATFHGSTCSRMWLAIAILHIQSTLLALVLAGTVHNVDGGTKYFGSMYLLSLITQPFGVWRQLVWRRQCARVHHTVLSPPDLLATSYSYMVPIPI